MAQPAAFSLAFFLATSLAFCLILRLTAKEGVSQGFGPTSSEKGNSFANSVLLNGVVGVVNLSFFLALGVIFGLGGTGGFLGPRVGVPCFIPWVALTNCVNQTVGALFWSNGVIDGSRL